MVYGLSIQAWITIIVLLLLIVANVRTKIPPEFLSMGALGILLVCRAIDEHTALSGFASDSVVVSGIQDILIVGLMQSGFVTWVVQTFLGRPSKYLLSLLRLCFPVSLLSAVMDNGTVTSMFVNIVKMWSRKIKTAPSRLLMPVAYVALLGGSLTILGSASNIVLSGLYTENTGVRLNVFEITLPGLFCFVTGVIAMYFLHKSLPERGTSDEAFANASEYTVELLVPTENAAVGSTVAESGLDNVPGGRLIEIVRFDREVISPVPTDEFILGGDRLVYAGEVDEILNLRRTHGLVNANHHVFSVSEVDRSRRLRTGYIKYGSPLIGKKMEDTSFESDNNLTLVAVSRKGERIRQSPREIVLEPGDSLLIECPPKGGKDSAALGRSLQFFESDDTIVVGRKTVIAPIIITLMLLLQATGVLTLLQAVLLAALAMILTGCATTTQAREGIGFGTLIVIACAIGFGKAIQENGLAEVAAKAFVKFSAGSPFLLLALLSLGAILLTTFLNDMVAAAVFFPVVYQCTMLADCNVLPFVLATMLSVNASYASPYASPVNLAVFAPGGYTFMDFVKFGVPMSLVQLASILFIIPLLYPLN